MGLLKAEVDVYDEEKKHVGRGTTNLSDIMNTFNHHIFVSIDIQQVQSHKKLTLGTAQIRAMVTDVQSLSGKSF